MDAILRDFIEMTAWEMEKPAAYGAFHLTFTFVGLAISIALALLFRKFDKKGNRIVLMSCGIFLVLTEIYKQLFYYYHMGNGSYQWWIFPFQLCSVPMYLCLIAPWLKPGKVQRGMYTFMMTFNLLGGLMAFIEPSGIVHEHWSLTLHAFIWHMMLIFIGLYLGFSKFGGKTMKDYLLAIATFCGLCVIAFAFNLLLWDVSGGSVNNFYIGPAISPLAVFKGIATKSGWLACTLHYIPSLSAGAFLLFLPFYFANKAKKKALTKV